MTKVKTYYWENSINLFAGAICMYRNYSLWMGHFAALVILKLCKT